MRSIFLCFIVIFFKSTPSLQAEELRISLPQWTAVVDTQGLALSGVIAGDKTYTLSSPQPLSFQNPGPVQKSDKVWIVPYPQQALIVTLWVKENRLHVQITHEGDTKVTWPLCGTDPQLKAYLFPEGEGLYIPAQDNFWCKQLDGATFDTQSTVLPFMGYLYPKAAVTLIFHTELRNTLSFIQQEKRLQQMATHDFRSRDLQTSYEVSFSLEAPHPLTPSWTYKALLKEEGRYVTLKEKMLQTPATQKLGGALHAYLWGDGRTLKALQLLEELGIKRMWLGYEEKPPHTPQEPWLKNKQHYVDAAFIKKAKNLGYLIGPYDSWHTMQPPAEADCHNTHFSNFYPQGCVRGPRGILPGFQGRGCYTSMKALSLSPVSNAPVYGRFQSFCKTGINTYFLDCHATGELFDDFSPSHLQTIFDDRALRIKHLAYLSQQGVVLGSETPAAWAVPFLAFAHGSFATAYGLHWKLHKDKTNFGGWYPPHRPTVFFKTTIPSPTYVQRYNPRYRLPLFQAVFHESCVITDRWETPLTKFPSLVPDRLLLELLYGVPSMWSLDLQAIKKHGPLLKQLAQQFTPLHKRIMTEPLTEFAWLTPERDVQQITFGDKIRLTANFRPSTFDKIPPKSLRLETLEEGKAVHYTPSTTGAIERHS